MRGFPAQHRPQRRHLRGGQRAELAAVCEVDPVGVLEDLGTVFAEEVRGRDCAMGLLISSAFLSGEPDLCLVEAHAEPVMARDDDLGGRVGDPVPAVVIGARVPPP